jgi:hypothetical protein
MIESTVVLTREIKDWVTVLAPTASALAATTEKKADAQLRAL